MAQRLLVSDPSYPVSHDAGGEGGGASCLGGSSPSALLVSKETSSQRAEMLLGALERVEIGEGLISRGLEKMGGRFLCCRERDLVFQCRICGHVEVKPQSCGVRICPRCNGRRFMWLKEKFELVASRMQHPMFISLSVPSLPHDPTRADWRGLRACFSKLRRRTSFRRVKGGHYGPDVTVNPSSLTWNMHLHAVLECPWLDRDAVYKDWLEITKAYGGSTRNVYFERAFAVIGGSKVAWHPRRSKEVKARILRSCTTYLYDHALKKPSLPTSEHVVTYLASTYGSRLIQGFGSFFGVPPPLKRSMVCPNCEGSSWTFLGSMDFLSSMAEKVFSREDPLAYRKHSFGGSEYG